MYIRTFDQYLHSILTLNNYTITMKPGIVADEMFPEGTSAIMDMDDEVS